MFNEEIFTRKVTLIDKCSVKCNCGFNNQYDISCAHIMKSMRHLKHTEFLDGSEHLSIVDIFIPLYTKTSNTITTANNWDHNIVLNRDLYKVVHKYD